MLIYTDIFHLLQGLMKAMVRCNQVPFANTDQVIVFILRQLRTILTLKRECILGSFELFSYVHHRHT